MRRTTLHAVESLESRGLMSSSTVGNLATSLSVNHHSAAAGQAIVFTLTETNNGGSSVKVNNSGLLNGIEVSGSRSGGKVWKSILPPAPYPVGSQTIGAHQSLKFSWTWDGRSDLVNPANRAQEGSALSGQFTASLVSNRNESATFSIAPPITSTPPPIISTPPPVSTGITTTGLSTKLTTDKATYTVGEVAKITLTETNTTGHDITIAYGPSTDGFRATQGGATVWTSNPGFQPFFIATKVLHPGESTTFTATWDGKSVDPVTGAETSQVLGDVTLGNALVPGRSLAIGWTA